MAVTIDGSAGVTTNAGGSVNPSTNVEGINYSCRAWVNFNGTRTRMAAMQLIANATATSTSFVRVTVQYENTTTRDANPVSVAIFR